MATAQRITKDGKVYYRVQIRRPTKGVNLDEYFPTKRAADTYLRRVEHAISEGKPIDENVVSRETFTEALEAYFKDASSTSSSNGRPLKKSADYDRRIRLKWLERELFGQMSLKRMTWPGIDTKMSEKVKKLRRRPATR